MSFLGELKRRRVVRVAIVYGAVAFAVLQAADILVPALRLPPWTMTLVVLLLALGLPVALVISWAFQLTPDGIQRTTETAATADVTVATSHATERWLTVRTVILAGTLLLAGVAAGWLIRPDSRDADDGEITLAVLPFANVGSADDEYFADGMSDAVRGKLAALDGMVVIASSSTGSYRNTTKAPREIGRELGVRYLLRGTVRWARSADGTRRVQVNPELIAAQTGITAWQEPFDAVLSDVFAVQGEIASRVASALSVNLLAPQRAQLQERPTTNLAAYDEFLRGSALLREADAGATVQRLAAEAFQRATQLDTMFALAYAQLAYAHMGAYWYYEDHSADRLRRARAAADRALRLAPDLAEAHLADGYYWYWGFKAYERGTQAFRRAAELDRNNSIAVQGLAAVLRRQGLLSEAATHFARATDLDPRDGGVFRDLAITLLVNNQLAAADSAIGKALALAPSSMGNNVARADILYGMERVADAEAAMREAMRINGTEAALIELANRQWNRWVAFADSATWAPLERLPLTSAVVDTGDYYIMRAEWVRAIGHTVRAAALADSALPFLQRRARETTDDWWAAGQLAMAIALKGDGPAADRVMAESRAALTRAPDAFNEPDVRYHAARVALLNGDRTRAMTYLEGAVGTHRAVKPAMVRRDVRFAALRGDPRFERLVRPR